MTQESLDGQKIAHVSPVDGRVHPLSEHLHAVAETASRFAEAFRGVPRAREAAYLVGRLHDLGKTKAQWQAYIRYVSGLAPAGASFPGRPTHAEDGALYLLSNKRSREKLWSALLLSYAITGHHTGLPDFSTSGGGEGLGLDKRLCGNGGMLLPCPVRGCEEICPAQELAASDGFGSEADKEHIHLLVRMLYSALVDADYLDTERFMAPDTQRPQYADDVILRLRDRMDRHIDEMCSSAPATPVNIARKAVLEDCRRAAAQPPGAYTLTVPTGGGKTLAAMSFALRHAAAHGMRRVIVAAPYTSIIEQTAAVYKYGSAANKDTELLGADNVLEQHSGAAEDALGDLRLAAQNWDAPVVVTTHVQLIESLFAARPAKCRKVHNIAGSVIVIDEAQKIPTEYIRPVLSVLRGLTKHYGVTVVLCTATQPGFGGWIEGAREHCPGLEDCKEIITESAVQPMKAFNCRVKYEIRKGAMSWAAVAGALSSENQVLCVVRKRDDCRRLAALMPAGTIQLSRYMCGEEIAELLSEIKARLAAGMTVRVVSTSLVEAGVDLDFPVVWAAMAPLDSLIQAGGRCNRSGRMESGRVVVFCPQEPAYSKYREEGAAATAALLEDGVYTSAEIESLYPLYLRKRYGEAATFDRCSFDRRLVGGAAEGRMQYREFAEEFKIINDAGKTVYVPYKRGAELIEQLRSSHPQKELLSRLQRYAATLPEKQFDAIYSAGGIETVHDNLYILDGAYYIPGMGVCAPAAV